MHKIYKNPSQEYKVFGHNNLKMKSASTTCTSKLMHDIKRWKKCTVTITSRPN